MKRSTISNLLREFSDALEESGAKIQARRISHGTSGRGQRAAQDAIAAAGGPTPGHDLALWVPSTGDLRARLRGHTGAINAIVYSADGSSIASCSTDGTTRIWQVKCIKGLQFIGSEE
jgi:hypothetical protein